MSRNEAQIDLTASDSKLINVLSRSETRIKNYGREVINVFKRVNASLVSGYRNLGSLGPIGASFGIFEMVKDAIEFDNVLRKIGRTSGASAGEMAALRKEIVDLISPGSGIPLTKGQFADMAGAMRDAGMPIKEIAALLPEVGKGAVAAQVDVKEYGKAIGELVSKFHVAASDIPAVQDQLNAAMKLEGVSEHPEEYLASIGHLAKGAQLLHAEGLKNITPLLAMQAQLTRFAGGSGEATAAIDAILNGLLRMTGPKGRQVRAGLKSWGVDFFNAKGNLKSFTELLPEFKKLADVGAKKGHSLEEVAMGVFGKPGAGIGLMMLVQQYQELMKTQEDFFNSTGSKAKDFKTEAESMRGKLILFQNQLDKFKVDHMTGMLEKLSTSLTYLDQHPTFVSGMLSAGVYAAAVVGVSKVITAMKELNLVLGTGPLGAIIRTAMIAGALGTAFNEGMGWVSDKTSHGEFKGSGWFGEMSYAGRHRDETEKGALIDKLSAWAADANKQGDRQTAKDILNQIKLIVNIDKNGNVRTESNDRNTYIDVARGNF